MAVWYIVDAVTAKGYLIRAILSARRIGWTSLGSLKNYKNHILVVVSVIVLNGMDEYLLTAEFQGGDIYVATLSYCAASRMKRSAIILAALLFKISTIISE